MKKAFVFGAMALLSGCICATGDCGKEAKPVKSAEPAQSVAEEVQPVVAAMPCTSACVQPDCMGKAEPVVLKPRVVEKVQAKRKRPCCDDNAEILTGEDEYYVPDAPEIYVISANRTVNSMQTEAAAFFKQVGKMRVFIDNADAKSADLPGGIEKGTATLKTRFEQMNNVYVVDKKRYADYIVSSRIDWYDTATKTVPALKYDLFLNSPDGQVIGEWSEIIHQAEGDRSWW